MRSWLPHPGGDALDAARAAEIFPALARGEPYSFDPRAILLPVPSTERVWPWPEHPEGEIRRRTNARGLQDLEETSAAKRTAGRVLVCGDSHVEGVVKTEDNLAHVLERLLLARDGPESWEVLNAGCAYTGPRSHTGVLEHHAELDPDVLVSICFVGNDFWDDLLIEYEQSGWGAPRGSAAYRDRLESAAEAHSGAVYQGFNQAYRFAHFPGERERALQSVRASYAELRSACDARGVALAVAILPTKMAADRGDDAEVLAAIARTLALEPEELGTGERLGADLARALREAGTTVIELLEPMSASREVLYWRRDYHLSTSGHALVAELLLDVVPRL
jgi:hypothetical protein